MWFGPDRSFALFAKGAVFRFRLCRRAPLLLASPFCFSAPENPFSIWRFRRSVVYVLCDYDTSVRYLSPPPTSKFCCTCSGRQRMPADFARETAMEPLLLLAVLPTSLPRHFLTKISKYMIFLIGTPKRLEMHVSHRKQTIGPLSNRDKIAFFPRYVLLTFPIFIFRARAWRLGKPAFRRLLQPRAASFSGIIPPLMGCTPRHFRKCRKWGRHRRST